MEVKSSHMCDHFHFFMHERAPNRACTFKMWSNHWQVQLQQCVTIGTVEPSVKESSYFRAFGQVASICLPNDMSLESKRPRY